MANGRVNNLDTLKRRVRGALPYFAGGPGVPSVIQTGEIDLRVPGTYPFSLPAGAAAGVYFVGTQMLAFLTAQVSTLTTSPTLHVGQPPAAVNVAPSFTPSLTANVGQAPCKWAGLSLAATGGAALLDSRTAYQLVITAGATGGAGFLASARVALLGYLFTL